MEAEDLDHPLEPRDAAVGDASAAVRGEAPPDQAKIVEQRSRGLVAVVAEPPPHERQLSAIRLERVARSHLGCVARQLLRIARQRALELLRDVDERPRSRNLDGERTYLVAITTDGQRACAGERLVERRRPGRGIPVHVAADPGAERERARCARQALAPSLDEIGGGGHQTVLEEPQRMPDLVRDAQPVVTHLVRLPEQRHLLGDPLLGVPPLGGRDARIVEHDELGLDADVREQDAAARRLGRMRGEHELDPSSGRARRELVSRHRVQPGERVVE